ncbi:two component, sigma54 specific, transcriptional regulator, Fis family protein [Plesiocystis pacifica SIR-1]|uniref:Two component, sigma54 specific, transcriptional regulator, Fis family protein n=1 Tax=Plesiocystis pacifica SIR-1 TaxID=391625 RepID=A6GBA6_9BACT|nr:sigma 54-interacting transcriptional regulator [Plesiocystis pacifica]EDM76815.1 two component, sigma54 specific, transcriptional regulator, Fis family protein [Plesiocystis pacifica SIR-1]
MPSILIIDDEDKYLELCKRFMPEHDFVGPARSYADAAKILARSRRSIELVLLDVHFDIPTEALLPEDKGALLAKGNPERTLERLRRSQGLRILDRLRKRYPDLPVIVMTALDDLPLEADAERLHAEDYTYLLDDEYLDARALKVQVEGILARAVRTEDDGPFYWGTAAAMSGLRRRLTILARGQLPIIIQGETGTGKSLVAREFIHPNSGRAGSFMAVDLSTIPSELMGAHLFGVVKGAYTGANTSREGVLAKAHGGTLFLDEIGNLSLELQKSLLLVLQEGRYRPVGSVEERVTDVKVVVATNENLAQMVREGRFREDLYMRLNPATAVTLPSLRQRRDDFQHLLEFFLSRVCQGGYNGDLMRQYAEQRGLWVPGEGEELEISVSRKVPSKPSPRRIHMLLHPNSYKLLQDFAWPGNFRQFEMVLSNLVTFTLVELVDRVELVEPELDRFEGAAARADVIVIQPRTIRDLLRPFTELALVGASEASAGEGTRDEQGAVGMRVRVQPGDSLNAVSCEVERQYLESLYHHFRGDLSEVAGFLLADGDAGRKVQLRMNQLGIKLRELKRARPGGGG